MRLLAFLDKKRGKVETLKLQFEVSKILNVPLEDPSAIHRLITKREHAQVVQRVESQAEKRTEPEAVETQVQDEQEMQAIDLKQKEKENLRRLATEQYCTAMRSLQMFAGRMASDTEHPTSPSKGGKGQCSLEASIQEDSLALVRMRTQQEFRDVMAKVDQEMNTDVEQAIQEAEVTLSKRKEKRREEFQRTRAAAQQKAESLLKENMRSRYKEIEKENEQKLQEPTEGEGLQAKLLAEQEAIELREAELREEEKSAQELLALIQKQEESAAIKLQCLQRARSSRKTVMIMRGQARTRAREAEQAEALNRDEEELGVLVKLAKESKNTGLTEEIDLHNKEQRLRMKHAEKKHEDGEELFMQEDEAKEQGTPKRSPEIINAQIELKELEKQRKLQPPNSKVCNVPECLAE